MTKQVRYNQRVRSLNHVKWTVVKGEHSVYVEIRYK
jgi:hypothetical protein